MLANTIKNIKVATMLRYVFVLSSFVLVSCDSATPLYTPFPAGYGYMQNLPALQKATDEGDREIIREHGWKLWAGIMQRAENGEWPLWYSWPNTKAAFASDLETTTSNSTANASESMKSRNLDNIPEVNTPGPVYDIPRQVIDNFPNGICKSSTGATIACDGSHFLFNGDIMIPTESLSQEAMNDIREDQLYLKSTLDQLHQDKVHQIEVSQEFIVTKHMYWPVKAEGITAIPVWKNNFPTTFSGYAGYEFWDTLVGVDPSGDAVGQMRDVEFLYGVKNAAGNEPLPTVKANARVHALDNFYYHKISEADWEAFDQSDKAVLTAASYWANDQPIGVGDYLITIAMHINTKELPSWTLQSVWWSDQPDRGMYATNRPALPAAVGPWDHYLLTDSYAVPANEKGELDIAVNPYIEGVTHPIATSCRNCHVRAGWPEGKTAGFSSYQNPDCPGLLSYLTPASNCLSTLTLSDYLWIIPDRAN